jgi:hypothetical protein
VLNFRSPVLGPKISFDSQQMMMDGGGFAIRTYKRTSSPIDNVLHKRAVA